MKILALDTSGVNCGVTIIEDANILADFTLHTGTTHSQNLVPMIEQALRFTNFSLEDMDAFACSVGPGSFTGLRIGIATIKGFAIGLQKPTIAVPTLLAVAYQVPYQNVEDSLIVSLLDAKNENVYAGIYQVKDGKPVLLVDPFADSITVCLQKVKELAEDTFGGVTLLEAMLDKPVTLGNCLSKKIFLVGDGANVYKEDFQKALGTDKVLTFPEYQNRTTSLAVARAAIDMANEKQFCDYHHLSAFYLKKSQAERELEKKANDK